MANDLNFPTSPSTTGASVPMLHSSPSVLRSECVPQSPDAEALNPWGAGMGLNLRGWAFKVMTKLK